MTVKVEQYLMGTATGTGKDWVGFVPEGKPWATGMPWKYCAEGPLAVAMPSVVGDYEFILCLNDSLTVAERSEPVTIAKEAYICITHSAGAVGVT